MTRSRPPAFAAAATALAALAVHQARYGLVPDPAAAGNHGYLAYAPSLLALALAAALGVAFAQLAGGDEPVGRSRPRLAGRWLGAGALLLGVHASQELAEGHQAALVGERAWLVLPLAAGAGLLLALALDGARGALRAGAQVLRPVVRVVPVPPRPPLASRRPAAIALRRLPALAASGAGRGPPPVA